MPIQLGRYTFEGPYGSLRYLEDRSGVYVVLDFYNGEYDVIDIGESAKVKTRLENHDRRICWQYNAKGQLQFAAHYTSQKLQAGRTLIELELRAIYNPSC